MNCWLFNNNIRSSPSIIAVYKTDKACNCIGHCVARAVPLLLVLLIIRMLEVRQVLSRPQIISKILMQLFQILKMIINPIHESKPN